MRALGLVLLCRNHHWELDHGFLIIEDGKFEEVEPQGIEP
jgi:predicted restriction endonuclease